MDFMANKALMIGVGIFITLAIASGVLMIVDNIRQIYSQVYETDTNITSRFGEYDKYENSELLGIDLINAVKKYKNNSNVKIYLGSGTRNPITNTASINKSAKYRCTVNQSGDVIELHFTRY